MNIGELIDYGVRYYDRKLAWYLRNAEGKWEQVTRVRVRKYLARKYGFSLSGSQGRATEVDLTLHYIIPRFRVNQIGRDVYGERILYPVA